MLLKNQNMMDMCKSLASMVYKVSDSNFLIDHPVNVKSCTYIKFNVENNDKDPKFEVGDHVRISKHRNIFAKGYTPNWSDEVFVYVCKLKT